MDIKEISELLELNVVKVLEQDNGYIVLFTERAGMDNHIQERSKFFTKKRLKN